MARATSTHYIKLALTCCVALLLAGCEKVPEPLNMRFCKAIAEDIAVNPSDMTFVSVVTNADPEAERIDITFDDTDQFGSDVRRSLTCDYKGFFLQTLKLDERYLPEFDVSGFRISVSNKIFRQDKKEESPLEPIKLRICSAITEEFAITVSDMKFVSVYSSKVPNSEWVDVEFDDINQFGAKVRRTLVCRYEGALIESITIDDHYITGYEIPPIHNRAVTKVYRRENERKKRLWNTLRKWFE